MGELYFLHKKIRHIFLIGALFIQLFFLIGLDGYFEYFESIVFVWIDNTVHYAILCINKT